MDLNKENQQREEFRNILGQNLGQIRKGYQQKSYANRGEPIDVSDSIKKLYDHVSLDIARMSCSDADELRISGEEAIQNIKNKVNIVSENIKHIEESQKNIGQDQKIIEEAQKNIAQNQKDMENKINDQQKEYITILGIFASVVLAFTAGIAFSTSVLNNIAQSSIYRTILITLMIGLVLANILFGLFFYINRIVNKETKIYPLLLSNIIFVLLIMFTILAWNCGLVEGRNERIHNVLSEQPQK